jgi:hypothetical protein
MIFPKKGKEHPDAVSLECSLHPMRLIYIMSDWNASMKIWAAYAETKRSAANADAKMSAANADAKMSAANADTKMSAANADTE